jgi:hypothetical protein
MYVGKKNLAHEKGKEIMKPKGKRVRSGKENKAQSEKAIYVRAEEWTEQVVIMSDNPIQCTAQGNSTEQYTKTGMNLVQN